MTATVPEELAGAWGEGADAFMVLGLPYSAELTDRDVRAAYLARMRAVHPDAGGDNDAAAAVSAAFEALRSGVRRGELLAAVMTDRDRPPRVSGPGTGGVPDEARRAELRARVRASRAAQGLPPYITDPAVLDRIAGLLVVALGRGTEGKRGHPRSLSAAGPRREGQVVWQPSSWRLETRRRFDAELDRRRAAGGLARGGWLVRVWLRVWYGRPGWLAARIVLAVVAVLAAQLAAPGDPAVPAIAAGALTWLVLTGRRELVPPRRRG